MLRAPGNVILEVGPHLVSAVLDLVGKPEHLSVTADRERYSAGRSTNFSSLAHPCHRRTHRRRYQYQLRPRICPKNDHCSWPKWHLPRVDFDANTCAVDRRTSLSFDLDRYSRSRSLARQIKSQARSTLSDYLLSTVKLRNRGGPYQATFLDSINSFYTSLAANEPLDSRIDGATGRDVIDWCNKIIDAAGVAAAAPSRAPTAKSSCSPADGACFWRYWLYWSRTHSPASGRRTIACAR